MFQQLVFFCVYNSLAFSFIFISRNFVWGSLLLTRLLATENSSGQMKAWRVFPECEWPRFRITVLSPNLAASRVCTLVIAACLWLKSRLKQKAHSRQFCFISAKVNTFYDEDANSSYARNTSFYLTKTS